MKLEAIETIERDQGLVNLLEDQIEIMKDLWLLLMRLVIESSLLETSILMYVVKIIY